MDETWINEERHYLMVPYDDKDWAKMLGARWDINKKKWYYTGEIDHRFDKWVPQPAAKLSDLSEEQQEMIRLAKAGTFVKDLVEAFEKSTDEIEAILNSSEE